MSQSIKPKRATNRSAATHVNNHVPFTANNLFGRWVEPLSSFSNPEPSYYVVFSYGRHFPLYIYVPSIGQWFGNEDKYSRSTSRHASQARPVPNPDKPMIPLSTHKMTELLNGGLLDVMSSR